MAAVKNVWQSKVLPPVVVVSGSDHHRCRQEVKRAIQTLQSRGHRLLRISGEDHQALDGLVASRGFLTAGPVLVVVDKPEKVDPAIVLKHYDRGPGSTVLLLYQEGGLSRKKDSSLKQILGKIPKNLHAQFQAPKPWEAGKEAVKYLTSFVAEQGMTLDPRVAPALVSIQGTDLGLLQFEMLKCVLLARSQGVTEVAVSHLQATLSPISKASVEPVVRAMAVKNPRNLLRALSRLRSSYPETSPPTMLVCVWMGKAATRWLHAASLRALRVPDEDVAKMIGMHPYVFKKEVAPILVKWSVPEIVKLLTRITVITQSARTGKRDPWLLLEAQFLGSAR